MNSFPTLTEASVLKAIQAYDRDFPHNDYDNWQKKGNYRRAILHKRKKYPVKAIVCIADGQTLPDTSGTHTHDAMRALKRLGFCVGAK